MTLTKTKVKVKFSQKWVKKQRTGHISEAISPTDCILGTKVQPNMAHLMTQVSMTLTQGQGQRSRSNFSKMDKKPKKWSYLGGYFTSYLLSQLFVTHLGVALLLRYIFCLVMLINLYLLLYFCWYNCWHCDRNIWKGTFQTWIKNDQFFLVDYRMASIINTHMNIKFLNIFLRMMIL